MELFLTAVIRTEGKIDLDDDGTQIMELMILETALFAGALFGTVICGYCGDRYVNEKSHL